MEPTGSPGTPPGEDSGPPPTTPPAAAATPAGSTPGWVSTITSQQTVAGPAGLVYADVPARIFAYIIDAILLGLTVLLLNIIFGVLFLSSAVSGFNILAFVWFVVLLVIYAAGSAIYFIYTWTKLRGSPGQRILGLETLNAADGAVLTQPQAIRRWLWLFGPFVLAQVFAMTSLLGGIGQLLSFLGIAWAIYLLYTTSNSPTRQGYHDVQASTVVVKVGR